MIQVGWIVGVSLLVVSAAGSVYSGILIDSVAARVGSDPIHGGPPRKYADLGRAAFGTRGETVVKATQYAFLAGCIVAVQLTASQSLHTVIHALHGESCLVVCNTVIAVIMLPIMQLQVNHYIQITVYTCPRHFSFVLHVHAHHFLIGWHCHGAPQGSESERTS